MSVYQLSSTRLVLERARILLRNQEDLSARAMLGAVTEVASAIAVAEASSPSPEEITFLIARGKVLVERVRIYARGHGLHFDRVLTPHEGPDRHDTNKMVNLADVREAIAAMKDGALVPPPEVQSVIEIEQRVVEDHDTSPCPPPPETLSELPASPPSPAPASFRTFADDDEGDDDADDRGTP